MTRKRLSALVAAAVALLLSIAIVTVVRQRVQRRRLFRTVARAGAKPVKPVGIPPVEQWTQEFSRLDADDLAQLLSAIEKQRPDLYSKWSLGYLHARALVESNDTGEAAKRLAPFLEKGSPFRSLALYHHASISDAATARSDRRALIAEFPDSPYRDEVIDDEIEDLAAAGDPAALSAFANSIAPTASTALRRDVSARIVEALVKRDPKAALARALELLRGGTADDAADRAALAIDKPPLLAQLTPQQRAMLGETFQTHRHFDRAVAVLTSALGQVYSDDLQFALGRSYFGAENFAQAEAAYIRGANATKDPKQKATFLFHASRAAQLGGDDAGAERLMTAAIAVKGSFPATTAAITQRIRTRLRQRRFAEANADLALLRKVAPNDPAVYDGTLAATTAMIAAGSMPNAVATLNSVPRKLLDDYDEAEIAYWRGRAIEKTNPDGAVAAYLTVLRATVQTRFATFARQRLQQSSLQPTVARAVAVRDAQVARLLAAKQFDLARRIQTDRVLLSAADRPAQLQKLAEIYRQIPAYASVLDLEPDPLPKFPLPDKPDTGALLLAMGLYDEAVPYVEQHWGLQPARSALTRSLALNRGGASRDSIFAIEVMMKSVPKDFQDELLPPVVRELLYPRYFYDFIEEDAKKYGADPRLVLSIMREESRFDPRARSAAAARGLLQFIITTALDIGHDIGLVDLSADDLYDPRVVIRLGAKYIGELTKEFGGDRYRATAAYNAGPRQVALWSRLQPAPGEDYFVSAVNFDETKHYVRKVMNSYEEYGDVYSERAAGR